MGFGTSLLLIAIGAILRFATTVSTTGFNLHVVGDILMIVGGVGLILTAWFSDSWSFRNRP